MAYFIVDRNRGKKLCATDNLRILHIQLSKLPFDRSSFWDLSLRGIYSRSCHVIFLNSVWLHEIAKRISFNGYFQEVLSFSIHPELHILICTLLGISYFYIPFCLRFALSQSSWSRKYFLQNDHFNYYFPGKYVSKYPTDPAGYRGYRRWGKIINNCYQTGLTFIKYCKRNVLKETYIKNKKIKNRKKTQKPRSQNTNTSKKHRWRERNQIPKLQNTEKKHEPNKRFNGV